MRSAAAEMEFGPIESVPRADVGWGQLVWLMCGLPVEVKPPRLHARPWATWSLAALIAGFSLWAVAFGEEAFFALGLVPAQLWNWGGLTLVTSFFLHETIWHLLVNLYFLLVFGDDVEDRLGRGRYLTLIALSTLAGGLTQAAIDPRSTIPVIGASGGIAGVIAFYALTFPRRRLRWVLGFAVPVKALGYGLVFDARASVVMAMWIVLQVIGAATQMMEDGAGDVAYLVHLAGAAAGVVFWFRAYSVPKRTVPLGQRRVISSRVPSPLLVSTPTARSFSSRRDGSWLVTSVRPTRRHPEGESLEGCADLGLQLMKKGNSASPGGLMSNVVHSSFVPSGFTREPGRGSETP